MTYLLVIVAVVLMIIAIISRLNAKDEFESYDLKSRNYYSSIKKQLSGIEKQKLETHINQINYINKLVERKNAEIETITQQAEDEINRRVKDAEKQIENRWNTSNKDFYMCIALHYQSFTLADAIKFDSRMLQRVRNDLNNKIGDIINNSIKPLQSKIDCGKAIRADYSRIKQLHIIKQDYISKRDRLNNLIDIKEKMGDDQNMKTRQMKLYIKNNCGQKGRIWAEKIEHKHRNESTL